MPPPAPRGSPRARSAVCAPQRRVAPGVVDQDPAHDPRGDAEHPRGGQGPRSCPGLGEPGSVGWKHRRRCTERGGRRSACRAQVGINRWNPGRWTAQLELICGPIATVDQTVGRLPATSPHPTIGRRDHSSSRTSSAITPCTKYVFCTESRVSSPEPPRPGSRTCARRRPGGDQPPRLAGGGVGRCDQPSAVARWPAYEILEDSKIGDGMRLSASGEPSAGLSDDRLLWVASEAVKPSPEPLSGTMAPA